MPYTIVTSLEMSDEPKKIYCPPRLTIESLGVSQLLVETSSINIGGTGHFDAKETYGYFDWEIDEEEDSE